LKLRQRGSAPFVWVRIWHGLRLIAVRTGDPPPLKWSDSKYGFLPEEDCNAEEETQA